jgi:MoxR-like ATPase
VLRGRRFLVPQDVYDVAPEVLRHRVQLSYDAIAQDVSPDDVVSKILAGVPAPRVAPHQDAAGHETSPFQPGAADTVDLFAPPAAG